MSQSKFKQKEISQILLNRISKYFDNQKRVFKGVAFCAPPQDFIPPKSPGLIGLKGKGLLDYTTLLSPNDYEKNDKIILKYFC